MAKNKKKIKFLSCGLQNWIIFADFSISSATISLSCSFSLSSIVSILSLFSFSLVLYSGNYSMISSGTLGFGLNLLLATCAHAISGTLSFSAEGPCPGDIPVVGIGTLFSFVLYLSAGVLFSLLIYLVLLSFICSLSLSIVILLLVSLSLRVLIFILKFF